MNEVAATMRPAQAGVKSVQDYIDELPVWPDGTSLNMEDMLGSMQASLDRIEARHRAYLKAMEESYRSKAQRMRGVLADLGIDTKKIAAAPKAANDSGTGGPFVAPLPPFNAATFDRQVTSVKIARA